MSLWEFSATASGWSRANGGESEVPAPTNEEHDALMAKYADL